MQKPWFVKGTFGVNYGAVLLLVLLWVQRVSAQSPACSRFNEGTPFESGEVYDLLQDKSGYLWLATDRGVFRYDGYTFQSFSTTQGLTDNTIFSLYQDYAGRIWACAFNGRLCYIDHDRIIQYRYNDTLAKYLPGNKMAKSIHVSFSGAVAIGYLWYGTVEIDPDGNFRRLDPTL